MLLTVLLLIASLLMSTSALAADTGKTIANPFTDVHNADPYINAVLWAIDSNITTGTSETTFDPGHFCTRAEAVTFLWRAQNRPTSINKQNPFSDVSSNAYYYDAVLWAIEQGIVKGTTDTTFSPNNICSVADILTMLYRSNNSPAVTGNNELSAKYAGTYYENAMAWADENGILTNTYDFWTSGSIKPTISCSRYDIVTYLYNNAGQPIISVAGKPDPFNTIAQIVKEKGAYNASLERNIFEDKVNDNTYAFFVIPDTEPTVVFTSYQKYGDVTYESALGIKRFNNGDFAYTFTVAAPAIGFELTGALDAETFCSNTDLSYATYTKASAKDFKQTFAEISVNNLSLMLNHIENFVLPKYCNGDISIKDLGFEAAYKEAHNLR